jgi:hypothetical protein
VPFDPNLRRTRGSDVHLTDVSRLRPPPEDDEARRLANRDLDDLAAHRTDNLMAMARPKIKRASLFQVQYAVIHVITASRAHNTTLLFQSSVARWSGPTPILSIFSIETSPSSVYLNIQ